jgi:hypothetical protein
VLTSRLKCGPRALVRSGPQRLTHPEGLRAASADLPLAVDCERRVCAGEGDRLSVRVEELDPEAALGVCDSGWVEMITSARAGG